MKLILDFDDTLFKSTMGFKEHFLVTIEKYGVARNVSEPYYKEVRSFEFSLRNFLTVLFKGTEENINDIYEEIMGRCPEFINQDLLKIVKNTGKDNCYIVTNGEKDYQLDKIKRSGVASLFIGIHVVSGSKKEVIEEIARKNNNHTLIFVENRDDFLKDLDLEKYPNLKTILFDENGIKKVKKAIEESDRD